MDVFPDLTAPTVTVLTEAHGMAPEEVETLVTFPVETAVNGATGVRRVRSSTSQGISIVWVEFDWGTDIFRARQIVNERLQLVASGIPEGVGTPVLAPISSIMGEIMLIAVTGTGAVSDTDVRSLADWTIRRRLLAVPGVAQVIPLGGDVMQYQVLVNPALLAAFGVSLQDVLQAAEGSNVNASGGVFMEKGQEYLIRGTGRVQQLDDIAQTVVAVREATPVTIGRCGRRADWSGHPDRRRIGQRRTGRHPDRTKATRHEHPRAHREDRPGAFGYRVDPAHRHSDQSEHISAGQLHRDSRGQCPGGASQRSDPGRRDPLPLPVERQNYLHFRAGNPASH